MRIVGTVWGSTLTIAERKLTQIESKYVYHGIQPIQRSRNKIVFENNDIWHAVKGQSTIGRRANLGYIDSTINRDIIEQCIIPCISLGPANGVHYFNPAIDFFEEDFEDAELFFDSSC